MFFLSVGLLTAALLEVLWGWETENFGLCSGRSWWSPITRQRDNHITADLPQNSKTNTPLQPVKTIYEEDDTYTTQQKSLRTQKIWDLNMEITSVLRVVIKALYFLFSSKNIWINLSIFQLLDPAVYLLNTMGLIETGQREICGKNNKLLI